MNRLSTRYTRRCNPFKRIAQQLHIHAHTAYERKQVTGAVYYMQVLPELNMLKETAEHWTGTVEEFCLRIAAIKQLLPN